MIESLNRFEQLHGGRHLTRSTRIDAPTSALRSLITEPGSSEGQSYEAVRFVDKIPRHVIDLVDRTFGGCYQENPEGYVIVLEDAITVYARGLRGMIYGACDLDRMARGGLLRQGIAYNSPLAELRSLKVYLPPAENIGSFKEVIDLCCMYRCNTLIVEVGGAMQYRCHPEINEGWVEYCREMHEYSGKTTVIQEQTFPWGKNSIHCENGGGRYLSQDQVREIVDYCRERGIDVIPEMPTLSHCDYLLTRHHEFAERQDDPYPDTYCPSAPGVYEYVLDVLDEVIEVFRPSAMHIGHDELYSVAVCGRCRHRSAPDIYADDIRRIHDHLASRGVRTIIWSEKLLNSVTRSGRPIGGAAKPFVFKGKELFTIPATYPAIEKLPRDILCMHWYWSIVERWDQEFLGRGFPMFYGNLDPMSMLNAAGRIAAGAMGGGPSNWSYATLPYLQENGTLVSLAYASLLFWKDGMTDDRYEKALSFCFEDLYRLRCGHASWGPRIEILHTTTYYRPHREHVDGVFIDYEADTIGWYVVELEDGSCHKVPVVYGQNITNADRRWTRCLAAESAAAGMEGAENAGDYDCYVYDKLLCSVAYSTLPVRKEGRTWYLTCVPHPAPGSRIRRVRPVEKPGFEGLLLVKDIRIVEHGGTATMMRVEQPPRDSPSS